MGNCIAFDKHADDTYFTQIRRKSNSGIEYDITVFIWLINLEQATLQH